MVEKAYSFIYGHKEPEYTNEELELRLLVGLSYRYAQGDRSIQQDLLQHLNQSGYIDPKFINGDTIAKVASIAPPHTHTSIPVYKIIEENEWVWKRFVNISATQDQFESGDTLIRDITEDMIARERKFQNGVRDGREVGISTAPDSRPDPHASLLRRHALRGAPSGHKAFDELFKSINGFLLAGKSYIEDPENINIPFSSDGTVGNLIQLQKKWEENHPGEKFWDARFLNPDLEF